jgi:hypothetical protein
MNLIEASTVCYHVLVPRYPQLNHGRVAAPPLACRRAHNRNPLRKKNERRN